MNLGENLRLAIRALNSNKMRTALTMLGIIIGVAVTIVVVAIGQGARESVAATINSLGTNLIMVRPGPRRIQLTAAGRATSGSPESSNKLTLADAKLMGRQFADTIAAVAPQVRGNAQVRLQGADATTQIIGTTLEYMTVNNTTVRKGRFFTQFEDQGNQKVCVVGNTVASKLTGNENADLTGMSLSINRSNYLIVGMLAPKGSGAFGQDQDDLVIMPITAAMHRVLAKTKLDMISLSCVDQSDMALVQQQVTAFLRSRHHLQPPFPTNDDFQVTSQTDLLVRQQSVTTTMTTLLTAVAVISLIVGGIGIMNIMLVSVTERTREIGIRKAIGATPADIKNQFLIESAIIAVIGGMFGVLLGIGSSAALAAIQGWTTIVSPFAMIGALVVSAATGIFFGLYPAGRAAAMHPIDALRYE
ncbi:MAG: ABC transporter permease [Armatimonadetes bacterium]|nr:ABC transporter permease [Armatimonadota bacterium]